MSSLAFLASKSLKATTSTLPFSWLLLPSISSSLFSTFCTNRIRKPTFSFPPSDPPLPKKFPFKVTAHGRTWDDPYHWMSDINDPDFVSYLSRENSYAEAFMADTRNKQRELFSEMASRIRARISALPERWV